MNILKKIHLRSYLDSKKLHKIDVFNVKNTVIMVLERNKLEGKQSVAYTTKAVNF